MHKRRAIVLALVLVAVGAAFQPGHARASAYSRVLHAYQSTGSVPPCRFSSSQLAAALKGVDTYGQQYFADFSDAVQNALTARAAGACSPGTHPVSSAINAPQAPLPASATSPTNAGVPVALLVLLGVSLVIALIAAAVLLGRRQGWEPEWAAAWRHAEGEAGYRAAGWLDDLGERWRDRRR